MYESYPTPIAHAHLDKRQGGLNTPGPGTQTRSAATGGATTTTNAGGYGANGFNIGGGTPPSVYLICFVVIIILLICISVIITTRAMISRRRLHRAYADSGYSDAFFDTLTERDMRRAGMVGWVSRVGGGGGGSTKEKKVSQARPVMFEIGMVEGEGAEEKAASGAGWKGKGQVGMGGAWEGIKPISTSILLPPSLSTTNPSSPPPPLHHPPPSFLSTLTSAPLRPAPPPPPPPVQPKPLEEVLVSGARVEVSVLIALPCPGGGGWEQGLRERRRMTSGGGGVEEEEEGEELPEVWLGVEEGVVQEEDGRGRQRGRA